MAILQPADTGSNYIDSYDAKHYYARRSERAADSSTEWRCAMNHGTQKTRMRLGSLLFALLVSASMARADETCNSPYMSGLIKGQEDFIHVWTLGEPGLGDGSDK
ncbi:MAG TPA: hypothetical protein VK505_02780, partial [Steroidobacteraceae bacterium]|nr:hypothetical protein [Steroidobacteraceae bacterium]